MRLGDICLKVGSGATPRGGKAVYLEQGPYSLIRSQNIHNNTFHYNGLAYITDEQAEQLSNVAIEENDVLLNITGDSVARACQVPKEILPARVNQHVAIIRPNPSKLYHRFLRYYLVSPLMQNHMLMLASAGATRNALTKEMIESFEIPPFSIADQKVIASVLGALDDKIENNRRMNETLEEMARAIFKSWFVDFDPVHAKAEGKQPAHMDAETAALFPSSFGDDGLPVGWRLEELGELANILNGHAFKSADYVDKGLFLLRTKNFSNNGFAELLSDDVYLPTHFAEEYKKYLCKPFDFHVVMVAASLGKTAYLFPHMLPALRNQNMWCFRPKETFPFRFFINLSVKEKISHVMGWGTGSARDFFRKSDFARHSITICENELLNAFETAVKAFYEKISINHHQNETLAELRDTLLPKLMSGEIRVKDAEQEVEAIA